MISIHSPALGVTLRHPRQLIGSRISIHIPALGVTTIRRRDFTTVLHFNPLSRTGSDSGRRQISEAEGLFQSTLPHWE